MPKAFYFRKAYFSNNINFDTKSCNYVKLFCSIEKNH